MIVTRSSGKQQLKVYSLTYKRRKILNESCMGHFTTAPSHLRLHLYEIYTHLSDLFPYKVSMWSVRSDFVFILCVCSGQRIHQTLGLVRVLSCFLYQWSSV